MSTPKVYYSIKKDYDKLDNRILDWTFNGLEVQQYEKILVKPNILGPYPPSKHANTHWKFIEWILIYLKTRFKGEIVVGDSSSFSTMKSFEVSRIKEVCDRQNIRWLAFESDEPVKRELLGKEIIIPKAVPESDLIINLPKLKTHILMKYTGAVKNLYGCISGGLKPALHKYFPKEEEFANVLVELYHTIAQDKEIITIMDGICGMEGNGPGSGRPVNSKVVISSRNPAAVDLFASYYIGYKMSDILTNKILSTEFELVNIDTGSISKIPGYEMEEITGVKRVNFKKPDTIYINFLISSRILSTVTSYLGVRRPRINRDKCVGCNICEEICPVGAIVNLDVDVKRCINCYCCHEVCQYSAIDLRRRFMPF